MCNTAAGVLDSGRNSEKTIEEFHVSGRQGASHIPFARVTRSTLDDGSKHFISLHPSRRYMNFLNVYNRPS